MARSYEKFYHGKGIPKTDIGSKPLKGAPNSNVDSYRKKDGRFSSRRKMDCEGKAYVDLDVADSHRPYDHAHDLTSLNTFHKNHRLPTKKEQKEINKATRKRRFM